MSKPELITIERVQEEWKEDCVIDKVLLDESTLKTPNLHAKYLEYLNRFKKQLRLFTMKKKSIPVTERRNSSEYKELEEIIAIQEDGISTCESIITSINQRQWQIKNIISWRQFCQGSDPI